MNVASIKIMAVPAVDRLVSAFTDDETGARSANQLRRDAQIALDRKAEGSETIKAMATTWAGMRQGAVDFGVDTVVGTVVGNDANAKNLTGNALYTYMGPTLGDQFEFTRESHANVNKAVTSVANTVGNFASDPLGGASKSANWADNYWEDFEKSTTTVVTADRNSERIDAQGGRHLRAHRP